MAQRCEDTGQELTTGMAQLLDRIQSLSGGGLSGSANNALQSVSSELNQGLTTILNALDELAGKISHASSQYGVHDEDAASEIRAAGQATGNSTVISALKG
jgi:WXG100 family type VII secretion target